MSTISHATPPSERNAIVPVTIWITIKIAAIIIIKIPSIEYQGRFCLLFICRKYLLPNI